LKSVSRMVLWLGVLVLAMMTVSGPASAQVPNPKNDPVFATAKEQETSSPTQAIDSYIKIKNDNTGKDPALAAEALFRAAQFAVTLLDPSKPPPADAMERQRQEDVKIIVGDKAQEGMKQLVTQFATTEAAKIAEQQGLKRNLAERIDRRNSVLPTYKIIDGLVAMTGRTSAFSYWFALVLIAGLVTLLTWPLKMKMYKSQREMQRIQPLLKEIQEKYKGKPELNEKIMATYKEHNVNPFASCFPMFIQLPFLWWVYNMIRLYENHFTNGKFLWIGSSLSEQFPAYVGANLGQFDYALLFIYAGSNYLTMKLTPPSDPAMAQQQKTMSIMMTFMMIYFFLIYKWTAAFMLYWLALNLFSAWQQYYYIYRPNKMQTTAGTDVGSSGSRGSGGSGGSSSSGVDSSGGSNGSSGGARNGSEKTTRNGVVTHPVTPVPGGDKMRARPRRKRK
jgi:YidC/Oxa1 family membrane protein insertase